nr:MAG TPA: hypothetical protein [Caudoviricetes sp.]
MIFIRFNSSIINLKNATNLYGISQFLNNSMLNLL